MIGKYRDIDAAYSAFNALKDADSNIIFPMSVTGFKTLKNSIDEYILIEKNNKEYTVLRNEYGKLVEHYTNKHGWSIIDKFRYKKEETFWVWGLDNKSDRKTCSWIYQNMIYENIANVSVNFILTYKNKLLFRYDNGEFGLVICKTSGDCIILYNILEEKAKKDRIKNFIFIGDFSKLSKSRKKVENEIMEITGWNKKKVQMQNTSYYMKKK